MKQKIIRIIWVLMVILSGIIRSQSSPTNIKQEITITTTSNTGWSYLDYDASIISSLTGDIVLFFHADRCPTCRQAEKSFLETGIPAWLTILKTNYDQETELKKKYSVLSQTSYVYIKPDGTLIKRRVWWTRIDDIISKIQEAKANSQTPKPARVGSDTVATAYVAGWCFWCMEWPFESLEWVKWVTNWYIGGTASDANYGAVWQWTTKHREAVEIRYDPALITYAELIETYWRQIDPTDSGGQFADRGYQYTTAIYYSDESEQQQATQAKSKTTSLQ